MKQNTNENLQDGTKVVSGGADRAARMLDLTAGQTVATQVAAHDQPIRCVRFVEVPGQSTPVLVTGSWDKTIKYWDLRQSSPVASVSCQERVYSMDVINKLLVVATADRYINIINLDKPTEFYKTIQSPLKWQTRVVSCFTDGSGFAVGSIEGRCAIQYVEEKDSRYSILFSLIFTLLSDPLTKRPFSAPTSHSNAIGKPPQMFAMSQMFFLLTPSRSTLSTAPLVPQAVTARSTFGTRMPNTA